MRGAYPQRILPFSISEKLKGEGTKNQLTLVQRGGPAQNDPDKIMMTSHAHYFNVGEEEVLFLETDPVTTSPFSARRGDGTLPGFPGQGLQRGWPSAWLLCPSRMVRDFRPETK